MVSILSLSKILGADIEEQLDWFQSKGLIARRKNCSASTNPMDLQKRSDITDKYRYNMTKLQQKVYHAMILQCRWRCPVPMCKQSVSLRSGSFFEKSRLSLRQWLVLFYWWVREYPVTDAAEETEVEKKSAVQAYQYCSDICSWRLLHMTPLCCWEDQQ